MPLALLLALSLSPQLSATQVVALDFDQLAAGAQLAVWGKVLGVESVRREDNPKVMETRVTVQAIGRHVANARVELGEVDVFVVQGGWSGRFAQIVPGAPRFKPGEEIVVLLEPLPGGRMGIVGFNQGLWRVRRDANGATAQSDRSGVELVSPTPGGTVAPAAYQDGRPLDALWTAVGAAMSRARAGGAQ